MAGEELGNKIEKRRVTWEGVPESLASFRSVRVWTMEHSCVTRRVSMVGIQKVYREA